MFVRQVTKSLRLHAERRIELARQILKSDERREFDDCVFIEVLSELNKLLRGGPAVRECNGFRVRQGGLFPVRIQTTGLKAGKFPEFFLRDSPFQRRCRIDVHAKSAPVDLGNPHGNQGAERWFDGGLLPVKRTVEQRKGGEHSWRSSPKPRGFEHGTVAAFLIPEK